MLKIILYQLVICLITLNVTLGQQCGGLSITSGEVVAGETLKLSYNPQGGVLEKSTELFAMAYMYNFYHWEQLDVVFKYKKGVWKAELKIPENCGFIAFKFQSEQVYPLVVDNNDNKGYMYIVKDKSGSIMPGGFLASGVFRMPSLGGVKYFKKGYQEISIEKMTKLLDKEMEIYGDNYRYFFPVMISLLKRQYGENYKLQVKSLLASFEKEVDLTEEEYITIMRLYKELGDEKKAENFKKLILQRFPYGKLSRLRIFNSLKEEQGEQLLIGLEQFRKDFPIAVWRKKRNEQAFIYSAVYKALANHYFLIGDYVKLEEILQDMEMRQLVDFFRKNIEYNITRNIGRSVETYVDVSKVVIDQMFLKVTDGSFVNGMDFSQKQSDFIANDYLDYCVSVHALLAWKSGRKEEAVMVKNLLVGEHRYRSFPMGNEAYYLSLKEMGKEKEAIEALKKIASVDQMTPFIYQELQAYYNGMKKEKKKVLFEEWVETLKSPKIVAEIKNKLRTKMTNEAFQPFVLETHQGDSIDFSQLNKGIVVIDFWSTWCAPCIRALPGMQLAVNRYKNDAGVKFYFVVTMIDKINKEVINNLWKKNDFQNMPILYDAFRTERAVERQLAFQALKKEVTGIPFKVILKDGKIRYRSEGYNGSPSKTMTEIAYVIEMLKKEDYHGKE